MKRLVFSVFCMIAAVVFFSGCVNTFPEKSGKLYVRALIDGEDVLYVKGNTLWFQHRTFQLPGRVNGAELPVYVGEEEWYPEWNGFVSDTFVFSDNPEMLPSGVSRDAENMRVKCYTTDFGECKVLSYPSKDNDYTLAVLLDDRKPDGAHWFVLDIDWWDFPLVD